MIAEPQHGFRVAPASLEDFTDLTLTRIDIENLCLARSIEQGGVDWETGIVAALHRLSRTPYWAADDEHRLSEEWALAHNAFHEALVFASGSAWLSRIRSSLYQQSERYRRQLRCSWHNGYDKRRRMRLVVINQVRRFDHARCLCKLFSRVHISVKTREIAAGNL